MQIYELTSSQNGAVHCPKTLASLRGCAVLLLLPSHSIRLLPSVTMKLFRFLIKLNNETVSIELKKWHHCSWNHCRCGYEYEHTFEDRKTYTKGKEPNYFGSLECERQ